MNNEACALNKSELSIAEQLEEISAILVENQDKSKFIACNLSSRLGQKDSVAFTKEDDSILETIKGIRFTAEQTKYWLEKIADTLY